MVQFNQKKQTGPSGQANVKVGAKNVRITFKDTGDVYEISNENWGERPGGDYSITLNKSGDKVFGIRPLAGTYVVRFKKFANRIDEIPNPRIQRGGPRKTQKGQAYIAPDKLVFDALLEVESEDRFNGLNILCILAYGFEPLPGTSITQISVNGKKDLENIETFLRVAGFDFSKDIPYAPNVLPWLEEELKRKAVTFMVTIGEKGFIDSMSPIPAHLQKPPKKASKK